MASVRWPIPALYPYYEHDCALEDHSTFVTSPPNRLLQGHVSIQGPEHYNKASNKAKIHRAVLRIRACFQIQQCPASKFASWL